MSSYDVIGSNGKAQWIDGCSTQGVTAFPFNMPANPCEITITHASEVGHPPGASLCANASVASGDIGKIDPNKDGGPESILCVFKNTHNGGHNASAYIAPGASAFLNVQVAPHNAHPVTGLTTTFGLISNITPLK